VLLDLQDFADVSAAVPLMAKVYPNGLADVNAFHASGGLQYMIGELLDAGLLHEDVTTIMGEGLRFYAREPKLRDGALVWEDGPTETLNDRILRPAKDPFQPVGGLTQLEGPLGRAVIKVSAVAPERQVIEAPARVFHSQEAVKAAFRENRLTEDAIVVVRYQGPRANGMPELHALTPTLSVLKTAGLKVALVTDGRMSGASGAVPAAIHVTPEAAHGGAHRAPARRRPDAPRRGQRAAGGSGGPVGPRGRARGPVGERGRHWPRPVRGLPSTRGRRRRGRGRGRLRIP
jgi:phosphogluconate dehydratase